MGTAFDDILLLDMPENMNAGKTHGFFSWASQNAMVPDYEWIKASPDPAAERPSMRSQVRRRTSPQVDLPMLRQWNAIPLDSWDQLDEDELPFAQVDNQEQQVFKLVYRGEKRPDYVVKADDDSFIMLGELERRLRVLPRKMTYWGCEWRNEA